MNRSCRWISWHTARACNHVYQHVSTAVAINLQPDEIRIIPLKENSNPASDSWQLMADSGINLAIPAHSDIPPEQGMPTTPRAFLIREFANTLSRGSPGEIAALSLYLGTQSEDLSGELMPLLETAIGDDRQQWATVAANLHAAQGWPRPSVAQLFSGKPEALKGSLPLAQAALRKLKPSPATR